ncbi:MAG: hypothetical protein WC273_00430 [Dehalococcoidia bacterium]
MKGFSRRTVEQHPELIGSRVVQARHGGLSRFVHSLAPLPDFGLPRSFCGQVMNLLLEDGELPDRAHCQLCHQRVVSWRAGQPDAAKQGAAA